MYSLYKSGLNYLHFTNDYNDDVDLHDYDVNGRCLSPFKAEQLFRYCEIIGILHMNDLH